jgi:hypothetical protein
MRHWVRFCDFDVARGILGHHGIECRAERGSGCSAHLTTGVVGGLWVRIGFVLPNRLFRGAFRGILGHFGACRTRVVETVFSKPEVFGSFRKWRLHTAAISLVRDSVFKERAIGSPIEFYGPGEGEFLALGGG